MAPILGGVALPDDDRLVLLHNPRCSKSRAARALLEERGAHFEERRYLEQPLDRAELEDLRARLGRPPGEWVRRGEADFREAGLDASASDAALLDAMARRPILIERPILVRGRRAVVGRPPESLLELLREAGARRA
jgi:arsenate reductase (glutaredoxin)